MALTLNKLANVSPELESRFRALDITNADHLLRAAATAASRQALAKSIGVDSRVILELANRADLARIRGVGSMFSDLLELAGVDTVKELAARVPEHLHAKLVELHGQHGHAQRAPKLASVQRWVTEAKTLPTLLEY